MIHKDLTSNIPSIFKLFYCLMNQSSINNIDSYASSQVISNCNSGSIKSLGVNESKENLKSDNLGELHALLPDGTVYKSKMNILNSLGVEFLSKFMVRKLFLREIRCG
jgi:hypothetical protein